MLQRQPPGGGHPRRSVAGVCSLVITSHHLQAASPRSASWAAAASTPAPSCQPSRWRARSAWRSTGSSWRRSGRRRAWGITEKRLASCDLITFRRNKFIFIELIMHACLQCPSKEMLFSQRLECFHNHESSSFDITEAREFIFAYLLWSSRYCMLSGLQCSLCITSLLI